MLGDLLNNIKSNLSAFGVDDSMMSGISKIAGTIDLDFTKLDQVKDTLKNAISQASADGQITLDDLHSVTGLQSVLGIDDNELGSIKSTVLEQVIARVTKDGVVSDMEMKIVDFLHGQVGESLSPEIQNSLMQVRQLHQNG